MAHLSASRLARDGFITHVGRRSSEVAPIALFIAVFTGIVLSPLVSYIFTDAVPL